MNTLDQQDKIIYGVLGLSFLALLLFKSSDLIEGINAQSLVTRNASAAAKDSRIAEKRFGNCNTGFALADGTPNLIEGQVPLDIRSLTPLASGSILCDETGATAIVAKDGTISDIRVSATVRKAYQQQAFRNENLKVQREESKMLKLLKFLLLIAGAFLLVANIEPYIAVTRLIFGDASAIYVCAEFRPIPFIGGFLQGGCGFLGAIIYSLGGFIVWAIFQLVELLPIANSFNIPFLSNLLSKMQTAPQVDEEERDRAAVKRIKQKHNSIVERSLGALLAFSWVMYLLDLGLMSWLYSPLSEIGELDIKALMRVLLGVFGVEIVILGLTLISNIIDPASIKYQQAQQKPVREY